jgi:glycosyltransferase involved in cell wall biosynthesis
MSDASPKADLAVVLLTFNEALHLPRALASVSGFAREIFVIDSYSTDNTVEIALAAGAQVLQHPFQNQARQFQWALDNAPMTSAWVMRLDADEIIEADLAEEIITRLPQLPTEVTGINLNRKTIYQGKHIRYGGRYPMILLRIWRRGMARMEDRWMDEHIYLTEGSIVDFRGGFADHNLNDLTYFTEKHNQYASREALEVVNQRLHLFERPESLTQERTSRQARIKRLLKESIFNRVPFELAAFGYFLIRYVLLLGFLDGRIGLEYHTLQCFWYRFLVGAKVRELEAALKLAHTPEEKRATVERLTRRRL